LIAPGSRQAVVKVRYTRVVGNLVGARAHLTYIVRDGVSRDGKPGRAYDAQGDDVDVADFLRRSRGDPRQFRVMVSVEDGARLADLKAFVRDLMAQMETDLECRLDWLAVDHFNTGYPHTHIVVRGRDRRGQELILAGPYVTHGVRARARTLANLELGPVSELERIQKLINEVGQERLTLLDRTLMAQARDGVLAMPSHEVGDTFRRSLRLGRLKTLERLGLAWERQAGVWLLDAETEGKLRRLGERADKFKMMQRALKEAGIERAAAALALFERGPRRSPLIGRVVGVGVIDEMTDRTWVAVDAVDGRVHYAELGRLKASDVPRRGSLVELASSASAGKPSPISKLNFLSAIDVGEQASYEGPTWIDQALIGNGKPEVSTTGFGAELNRAFAARLRWLEQRRLVEPDKDTGELTPTLSMMRSLRQLEMERLVGMLSRELGAIYVPRQDGERICGIYERAVVTPTGRLAVIRQQDTFTFAPWKPALEPLRGRAVTGHFGWGRVTWTRDRGRALPDR
jgi:type IV secretory pathway VirD2 relaxase